MYTHGIPRFTEEELEDESWKDFPTQPPICSRNDGIPIRLANLTISFAKWRKKSIEALGNAWVPQVAYEIFKAIEVTELLKGGK